MSAGSGGAAGVDAVAGAELVSRLLAATPPYLYNMPLVPHSYFFSEMLRSLVHARGAGGAGGGGGGTQAPAARRSRKRPWQHAKQDWDRSRSQPAQEHAAQYDEKYLESTPDINKNQSLYEKPLELTINKNSYSRHMPSFKFSEKNDVLEQKPASPETGVKSPAAGAGGAPLQEKSLALPPPPPPPPLWYPSLYAPPYGVDPLNFFIDLRVSGHIYDRKHGAKDAQDLRLGGAAPRGSPAPAPAPEGPRGGVGPGRPSAFSVPKPREGSPKLFPMNLCHGGNNKFNMKYYDDVDVKLHERNICGKNPTSTHYVMQNLKKIYGHLTDATEEDKKEEFGDKVEQEAGDNSDGALESDGAGAGADSSSDVEVLGEAHGP